MASAVLASRNEQSWNERSVYMRNYTNNTRSIATTAPKNPLPKPRPNPNPNPNRNPYPVTKANRQLHDRFSGGVHLWKNEEMRSDIEVYDGHASQVRKSIKPSEAEELSPGDYVTFKLGDYSRSGLKELKSRLISELNQVRVLRNRIASCEKDSRSGHRDSEFFATGMRSLQLDAVVESPRGKGKKSSKEIESYPASEFVTATNKEMVPSGLKKTVSGSKRSNPFGSGKDTKRPSANPVTEKQVRIMMRRCSQILTKLMKHKFGWVFNNPVDVVGLGLHDYHQIVKHPMDLGTVMLNLENGAYVVPLDFASDVRLTFNNALLYNAKGSDVNVLAGQFLLLFNEMFDPAYKKFEAEQRRVMAAEEGSQDRNRPHTVVPENLRREPDPVVTAKKSGVVNSQIPYPKPPAVQGQTLMAPIPDVKPNVPTPRPLKFPKPKARDPHKREMTIEEKARLGVSLQNLPPEKMGQLVHILNKRNGHLAQDGDEIELDIEAIDTETLWELDRFVSNHKKMVTKIQRQNFVDSGMVLTSQITSKSSASVVPEDALVDSTSSIVQKSKKAEAGEEDVDIGEEIPIDNYPPVVIEKDVTACASSGSSSSDSSSSSSGTSSSGDSGSSSGSDSDADGTPSPPFVEPKEAHVT